LCLVTRPRDKNFHLGGGEKDGRHMARIGGRKKSFPEKTAKEKKGGAGRLDLWESEEKEGEEMPGKKKPKMTVERGSKETPPQKNVETKKEAKITWHGRKSQESAAGSSQEGGQIELGQNSVICGVGTKIKR